MPGRVVVVGGANTDIVGRSYAALVARDSNPGHVTSSAGGVGRNIAENLARLGTEVSLLTVFGDDETGRWLAQHSSRCGVDVGPSLVADKTPGSRYLAILDDTGDLALAIADMRALELLTPAELEARRDVFGGAALVVIDANLPEDSLAWLATNVTSPLLYDPVSSAKVRRGLHILASLAVLKCNVLEAGTLLEADAAAAADPAWAARMLLHAGVSCAIVTAGVAGAFWADTTGEGHVPSFGATVVNATGAGDAFSAGVAYAFAHGKTTAAAVEFASAVAAIALGSEATVSPELTQSAVDALLAERRR